MNNNQLREGNTMAERGAGQRSWPLSPYEVNVSFARTNAAGDGAAWFGPLTPITPLAPPEVAGRQWDYPAGYNLSTLSRPFEPITFSTLRALADGYDLLRLVIETRKDQAARQTWNIAARDNGARSATDAARIATVKNFFARPDGIHGFADWLRMLLEEVFVTDAPALYMSRDRGGRLKALMPLDGATIKPVIDSWGRVPQPYLDGETLVYPAAYQQILKGYPAIDYSVRDLTYRPRNPRVNRVYGMSPVEQVVTTVNIALRRQLYLLDYFAEGNIPDSLIGVPESWTPDQIASYQKYWDAYFEGDLGRRRRAKFIPGGVCEDLYPDKGARTQGAVRRMARAHRLLCFLDLAPGSHPDGQPGHRRDPKGTCRGGGPGTDPRLGEGAYRRHSGGRIRRVRSRIRLERESRNRSRDARDDPFGLYLEGHFDHQRGTRRLGPRAADGSFGE
jgi:hypothetical protein